MAQSLDKTAVTTAQTQQSRDLDDAKATDPGAQSAMNSYMAGLGKDDLADLTASQRAYIENIREIEKANPKATPEDIAMAISVVLWEGRIWNADGTAADVTSPLGVPLVLDYKGGKGYQDVKVSGEQEQALHKQRTLTDAKGRDSGVAHTFPAVAAKAGRHDTLAGSYNATMVTSGGDAIQDLAQIIVEQKVSGTFRDAEKRDNERALKIADANSDRPLSESLLESFRSENAADKKDKEDRAEA